MPGKIPRHLRYCYQEKGSYEPLSFHISVEPRKDSGIYDMCCQEKGSYTFVFQFREPRKDSGIYDMCYQEKGSYTFVFQFRRASEGFGHLRICVVRRKAHIPLSDNNSVDARRIRGIYGYVLSGQRLI